MKKLVEISDISYADFKNRHWCFGCRGVPEDIPDFVHMVWKLRNSENVYFVELDPMLLPKYGDDLAGFLEKEGFDLPEFGGYKGIPWA